MRAGAAAAALLLVTVANSAGAQIPRGTVRTAQLWFDAKATLGAFRGITKVVRGEMSGGPTLSSVSGFVEADVTTLSTDNGLRDKDMRKTMEVEKFKTIRFDLDSVNVRSEAGDSSHVDLIGRMTIHGVARHIRILSTVRRTASEIRVVGAFDVVLPQYGVTNLKRMLGTLRMNELIHVGLDVTFATAR